MTAATENATRLVTDAETLLADDSIPTAMSLAALAIEGAGKVSILRALAVARTEDEV
jgi:AbiV family abortive infection protein